MLRHYGDHLRGGGDGFLEMNQVGRRSSEFVFPVEAQNLHRLWASSFKGFSRFFQGPLRDFSLGMRLEVGHYAEEEVDLVRVEVDEVDVQGSLLVVERVPTLLAVERVSTM